MTLASQTRRRLLAGAGAAMALGPLHARAQGFPSKNIRVSFPPGRAAAPTGLLAPSTTSGRRC